VKVAIAGAGIAGGYLAALLAQEGLSPDVFDPMAHDTRCGCRSCGWGAPAGIGPYLDAIGLDPDDYVLDRMPTMNFDGLVANTPLLTVDKPRLLRDLARKITVQRRLLGPEEAEQYDLIVDATGIARTFLPPCRSDLVLPTLQHRVAVEPLEADDRLRAGVYGNDVPGLGYLWVFPLGEREYHVGVGGIGLAGPEELMERFYREMSGRFAFTRRCGCRGMVRVASPHCSVPFYTEGRRGDGTQRVVGVGESIGTVAPFTGEGIVFSLECARLLARSLQDPERYTCAVLARFGWMRGERETLDYLLARREKSGPRLRDRWRFYRNARRSGIDLPMMEAFRRLGSLSRWVDGPRR